MKEFIGCCGLDCESCEARIATVNDDDGLRRKVAKLWSEFNNVEITPGMIHCTGCRLPGEKTPYAEALCPIRRCVGSRAYATCADCAETEHCDKLGAITQNNARALMNLKNSRGGAR